jgi:hypothetical protein
MFAVANTFFELTFDVVPAHTFPDETRFAADTLPVANTFVELRFEEAHRFPDETRFAADTFPVAITLVVETAFAAKTFPLKFEKTPRTVRFPRVLTSPKWLIIGMMLPY